MLPADYFFVREFVFYQCPYVFRARICILPRFKRSLADADVFSKRFLRHSCGLPHFFDGHYYPRFLRGIAAALGVLWVKP